MRQITIAGKDPAKLNTNFPKAGIFADLTGGVKNTPINNINIEEPFKSLFAIKPEVLESITESMKTNGYDTNQPVIVWKEKNILIDGHTRIQAAQAVGIATVPAFFASFETEDDVLDYMHRLQFGRRNITDADLIRLIINALPNYEKKYGEGSKAEFLMKRFHGLSETKAKKAVVVIESGDNEHIKSIENGDTTISGCYSKINSDKNTPKQKVQMNFFEDDGTHQPVRFDGNGNFYYRNYEKQKEIKAFALPKFMNSEKIRQRIRQVLEEELGGNNG